MVELLNRNTASKRSIQREVFNTKYSTQSIQHEVFNNRSIYLVKSITLSATFPAKSSTVIFIVCLPLGTISSKR